MIGDRQDVFLKYEKDDEEWCINPTVLKWISPFSIGQLVRVLDDENTIKSMQIELGNKIAQLVSLAKILFIFQMSFKMIICLGNRLPTKKER